MLLDQKAEFKDLRTNVRSIENTQIKLLDEGDMLFIEARPQTR